MNTKVTNGVVKFTCRILRGVRYIRRRPSTVGAHFLGRRRICPRPPRSTALSFEISVVLPKSFVAALIFAGVAR